MDPTVQQWKFREGDEVFGGDGGKVGKIVAVRPRYIVVEKGFFFPTDYYIPTSAISTYDGNRIYLTVSKDEALSQGWEQEPMEEPVFDREANPATMGAATAGSREPMTESTSSTMPSPTENQTMNDTNPR
ncbi:MAG: PRC-barrel domain-containing protein [Thermomicrobiales bacterium]